MHRFSSYFAGLHAPLNLHMKSGTSVHVVLTGNKAM